MGQTGDKLPRDRERLQYMYYMLPYCQILYSNFLQCLQYNQLLASVIVQHSMKGRICVCFVLIECRYYCEIASLCFRWQLAVRIILDW